MSEHLAIIRWNRNNALFTDNRYSREHEWEFDGGQTVPASSSPHAVPVPLSNAANVDPEEAFVAALSSCHMLSFLWIAAKRGFVIDQYADRAIGILVKNADGKLSITRVTLYPQIDWSGDNLPGDADVVAMHHEAHEICFIANSVKTVVTVESERGIR